MSEKREERTIYLVVFRHDDTCPPPCGKKHFWCQIIGVYLHHDTAKAVRDLHMGTEEEQHRVQILPLMVQTGEFGEPWLGISMNVRRNQFGDPR